MNKKFKKQVSQILNFPKKVRHKLHNKFPSILGHEIQKDLIQFYRNDNLFKTVISFNHFIEFFSQIDEVQILVKVQAHNRGGKSLGVRTFSVNSKGASQLFLNELFSNLDSFGLFSVSMELNPVYSAKIGYLGKLAPQFMTIYVPQNEAGCPQMIHSHKLKQGHLFLSREYIRNSGHIEALDRVNQFDLFVLNSSKSKLKFKVQITDENCEGNMVERSVSLTSFQTACLHFEKSEFNSNFKNLHFKYFYNRPVDHKKPIIFREFQNNSWSCNHT